MKYLPIAIILLIGCKEKNKLTHIYICGNDTISVTWSTDVSLGHGVNNYWNRGMDTFFTVVTNRRDTVLWEK
jgi:hypothetical protein